MLLRASVSYRAIDDISNTIDGDTIDRLCRYGVLLFRLVCVSMQDVYFNFLLTALMSTVSLHDYAKYTQMLFFEIS